MLKNVKLVGKIYNTGLGWKSLGNSPEAQSTKAQLDNWDFNQVKSFYTAKETTNEGLELVILLLHTLES